MASSFGSFGSTIAPAVASPSLNTFPSTTDPAKQHVRPEFATQRENNPSTAVTKSGLRPGLPTWSSQAAREEFDRSEAKTKYDLVRHGLNVSLLNAAQDLLNADPTQNLAKNLQTLLSTYNDHRSAIDAKYSSNRTDGASDPTSMSVDASSRTASTVTPPSVTVTPPVAPPVPPSGPLMFGGKIATFGSSTDSSTSSSKPLAGAPTVPTGGFSMFGAVKGPATSSGGSASLTDPEPSSDAPSSTAPAEKQMDSEMLSAPEAQPTFGAAPKPSPFSPFGDFSKPKIPSPLASQPPISASSSLPAPTVPLGGASTSGALSSFGNAGSLFGSSSFQQSETGASSSFASQSSKATGSTLFGSALTGTHSFGFGKPATPGGTGFSFATGPLSASKLPGSDDAKDKTADGSTVPTNLVGPSPASTTVGTRDTTPEPEGEGEENEATLHETRCKLFQAIEKPDGNGIEWIDKGVGSARLKKDKHSEKRRLLFRQEGTSRVQMNFYLYPALQATVEKRVAAFTGLEDGKPVAFRMRCKSEEEAASFQSSLQREVEALMTAPPGIESEGQAKGSSSNPQVEEVEDGTKAAGPVRADAPELLDKPEIEEAKTDEGRESQAPEPAEEDEEEHEEDGVRIHEGDEGDEPGDGEDEYEVEYDQDEYEYEDGEGDEEQYNEEDGDAEGEDEEDQVADDGVEGQPAEPEVVELLSDDDEE